MSGPYNYRWQRARERWLRQHPLCAICQARGVIEAAEVVDHIVPHRDDPALFWDKANWQSLSKRCHDSLKQSLEKTGRIKGADVNGLPLDPAHPWRRP
jgi:5-methylcytosine-specific restriction endonuclease McrA